MTQQQALVPQERTPYQIMDALDDDIIKAELENRIVDTWVYSFSSDGKPQTGLSKIGVDASCTEMAKQGNVIREGIIAFQADPTNKEFVLFQGMATRYIVETGGHEVQMESVNGTKRQWIKMKLKSGKIVDDPFWYEKGAMKALRNARSRLIPEEIKAKIIALAKQKGRVKPIDKKKTATKETPDNTNGAKISFKNKVTCPDGGAEAGKETNTSFCNSVCKQADNCDTYQEAIK